MVQVVNSFSRGVQIHCHKIKETEGGRVAVMHEDYPHPVTLNPGVTEVDDGFWAEWKAENPDSELLRNNVLMDKKAYDAKRRKELKEGEVYDPNDPLSPQDAGANQEGPARDAAAAQDASSKEAAKSSAKK